MNVKPPTVTCVIVNWNNWKLTIDCLASLKKTVNRNHNLEIVVVDNGSTDSSLENLEKNRKKYKYELLKSSQNLGFAGGNNFGINHALKKSPEFLFLLNNDTLIDANCIEELIDAAIKYKDAKIFTPKIYFARGFEFHRKYLKNQLGKVIWAAGGVIDWRNVYATNLGVDGVDSEKYSKDYETDFATGAAMFLRSSMLREIGLFDERYYLYFEDVDLCERYKRSGGKIMFISKSKVWHKVSQSSGIGSDLNDYFITRNRLLFGMGYAPLRTKIALYRESVRFLMSGRKWQKQGVFDFYTANFGRGSWKG